MKFLFFYLSIIITSLHAFNVDKTQLNILSKDRVWLQLLHFDKDTKMSTIENKKFFLSPEGKTNPHAELIATLENYDKRIDTQKPFRCLFPARYLWLSQKLDLPDYEMIDKRCTTLASWEVRKNVSSISTVFVSGFLGNPASAFGHSFFKINKGKEGENALFDNTIGYGAKLPKNYNMVSYMYNGLTGGYQGGYSDKYYYMDDMAYSNQEFREMWSYQLHLSSYEQELMLLHLWELKKVSFPYYFFNKNCGYKVSELLELVQDERLTKDASAWYAPIETFYHLNRIHKKRKTVDKITYIPSEQQKIYSFYQDLNTLEQSIVTQIIENEEKVFPKKYKDVKALSKVKILDFVLAFYLYKKEHTKASKALQNHIILARLALPLLSYTKSPIPPKSAMTEGNKPTYVSLGIERYEGEEKIHLGYAPFSIEALGYNTFNGDSLSVLEGSITISKEDIRLQKLDLIKIRRLKTENLPFDTQSPYSWSLHLGMEENQERDYFVDVAGGMSWQLSEEIKVYSLLHLSLHSDAQAYRFSPMLGLYANFDKARLEIAYGYENQKESSHYISKLSIAAQYRIDERFSFYAGLKKADVMTVDMGLKWYY